MRKNIILATLVFANLFLSLNALAEEEIKTSNKENIKIPENYHIDFGLGALSIQGKFTKDLTPYYEIGGRLSIGGIASSGYSYIGNFGADFSIENKFYFNKSSYIIKKTEKIVTAGAYTKAFVSIIKDFSAGFFPALGIGIGYDTTFNGIGMALGIDFGSTFQTTTDNKLSGIIFLRPEINFRTSF